MKLSRLFLNPASRSVIRALSDLQALHRLVMLGFPSGVPSARSELGVLFRLEEDERSGRSVLYVQSKVEPDWSRLPPGVLLDLMGELPNPAVRDVSAAWEAIHDGARLRIRLRANATKKIDTKTRPDGTKSNGTRVPVQGEEGRLAWLERQGKRLGFAPLPGAMRVREEPRRLGRRGEGRLTISACVFDGIVEVTARDRFLEALEKGVGPAKSYGCGLLSVGPAR